MLRAVFFFYVFIISLTTLQLLGGFGSFSVAKSEQRDLYFNCLHQLTEKNNAVKINGDNISPVLLSDPASLEVKSQVVAGTIYIFRVGLKGGLNGNIFVKIFQPLPYVNARPKLMSVAHSEKNL
nr:stefin 4_1 [Myxidium lieberkuehni]